MRSIFTLVLLAVAIVFTSCSTAPMGTGPYHVTAYKPHDPSKVRVKVSLSKQNVYVMEGDRLLMAAATCVGIPSKPTPKGNFTIYSKQEEKRSGSYGFRVQGDRVIPAEADKSIPGRYVGYPMGYLVRIFSGLRISSGIRSSVSAHARLSAFERRSRTEVFCSRENRDAGQHRDDPAGG